VRPYNTRLHCGAGDLRPTATLSDEENPMATLGVNIDHVATVRQARMTNEPDPVWAATLAELGGADGITLHLREDRRHIQERDLHLLRQTVAVSLNLEVACSDDVLSIACEARPDQATLVPERREEVTTEGGLDVAGNSSRIAGAVGRLKAAGVKVSLFLDPDSRQIEAGAEAVKIFDSWAGSLAPEPFERFAQEPARRITAALKSRHGNIPVIGFPKGAGGNYPRYARATGVDAVALDTSVPLDWARAAMPDRALQGNLDPMLMIAGGEALTGTAQRMVETMAGHPYIFNLGHGITPEADPANVDLLLRAIRG